MEGCRAAMSPAKWPPEPPNTCSSLRHCTPSITDTNLIFFYSHERWHPEVGVLFRSDRSSLSADLYRSGHHPPPQSSFLVFSSEIQCSAFTSIQSRRYFYLFKIWFPTRLFQITSYMATIVGNFSNTLCKVFYAMDYNKSHNKLENH